MSSSEFDIRTLGQFFSDVSIAAMIPSVSEANSGLIGLKTGSHRWLHPFSWPRMSAWFVSTVYLLTGSVL